MGHMPLRVQRHSNENYLSPAQERCLRLAAEEGALYHHRNRWAPPSRAKALAATAVLEMPYEGHVTVFALQNRGFLTPDARANPGNKSRPRVITEAGRAYLTAKP